MFSYRSPHYVARSESKRRRPSALQAQGARMNSHNIGARALRRGKKCEPLLVFRGSSHSCRSFVDPRGRNVSSKRSSRGAIKWRKRSGDNKEPSCGAHVGRSRYTICRSGSTSRACAGGLGKPGRCVSMFVYMFSNHGHASSSFFQCANVGCEAIIGNLRRWGSI